MVNQVGSGFVTGKVDGIYSSQKNMMRTCLDNFIFRRDAFDWQNTTEKREISLLIQVRGILLEFKI